MNKLRRLIRLIKSNKKVRNIILISIICVLLITGITLAVIPHVGKQKLVSASSSDITGNDFTYITPTLENSDEVTDVPEPVVDNEVTSFVPATKIDLDPSHNTIYVNKEYALPKDYKPDYLVIPNIQFDRLTYDERTLMRAVAAKAIEKLFAAAEESGYYLSGVSGYRSYARQYKIFTNNIVTQGKVHTLQYSAVPGTSEHQTGLAMDVSTQSLNNILTDEFADTPEGLWLAKNAYKYGFIIRYPKDKASITGYAYEPWHIRYVGRGLSYYLYNNKLTLDEYYKYTPSPGFNFEAVYAAIINYVAPTIPVSITPTITPTISPTSEVTEGAGKGKKPKDKKDTGSGDNTINSTDIGATPAPTPSTVIQQNEDVTVTDIPTNDGSDSNSSTDKNNNTDNSNTSGTTDIMIE